MSYDNYQEYSEIMDSLQSGTEKDWELIAKLHADFPNGCDHFVNRNWITNAIDSGSLSSVIWMLSKNINLHFKDDEGYTVLHSCIDRELEDKYKIMQLLIDNGADINILAFEGWTPLHMAIRRNDFEAIRILLQNGADTKIKTITDDYLDAEQTASKLGNKDAIELIRSYNQHKK